MLITAVVRLLRETTRVALDLVLPRPCPGCGGPEPWCHGCAAVLDARPRPVVLSESALDAAAGLAVPPAWAITRYTGPVRAAILAGKERGRKDLPPRLGEAVGRALLRMQRNGLLPGEVWVVPAPSRRAAARRRGGDPVTAMARAAAATAAVAGLTVGVAPCLYTARWARDSVGLDAAGRAANLAGRIRFRPSARPPPGQEVLLLDDVLTTGATLISSIRALSVVGITVSGALTVATAAPWRAVR